MKKLIFALIFAIALCFSGCTSHDFETYTTQELKTMQYEAKFVSTFGEPASNHMWGFVRNYTEVAPVYSRITRAHDVNGNLWYKTWARPINVTNSEKTKVINEFSKKREGAVNTINIDWENYWVQQVYTGTQTYRDGNGNLLDKGGTGSAHMNHLLAYNETGETQIIYPDWNQWQATEVVEHYEHINNFNSGSNDTKYTDDETGEEFIGTTLMKDMGHTPEGTPKFGYHNSVDSKNHFEYIILQIDGAYYVGFDFYATHPEGQEANRNMDVERDWVFNDWIVKISPAEYNKTIKESGRVICEDLGAADKSDFDFNDVVFDVDLYTDGTYKITLQAAGGTLPLTVGGVEVHDKFDVNTNVMVNTGIGLPRNPVSYTVNTPVSNIIDIPIFVKNQTEVWPIEAPIGKAPQKLCVSKNFRWCKEYAEHAIQLAYPNFEKWVKNPDQYSDWEDTYVEEHLY